MPLDKLLLYIVLGFVALAALSFIFKFLGVIVSFLLPIVILGVVGYFVAKALKIVS